MRKRLEDEIQRTLMKYAERVYPRECRWLHHVPNGGGRTKIEASILKGLGVKRGVSDLCLPLSIPGGPHGLYLELKAPKKKPTPEQNEFLDFVSQQGYQAECCDNYDDARFVLDRYVMRYREAINAT